MPLPTRRQGGIAALLHQTADVYAETDDYAVPVKTGLRCRLGHLSPNAATSGNERAELLDLRRLFWAEDYVMPAGAQVLIDGQRWNTMRGTFAALDGVADRNVYRSCDVRPV